ncbi:MAG: hypothetical protein PWP63_2261 [Methanolobus sp.]|nr:hypothetical protein [Methanolobus sp.]
MFIRLIFMFKKVYIVIHYYNNNDDGRQRCTSDESSRTLGDIQW